MCTGLAQGLREPECRKSSKEKVSLLKPYTNNDRINDMSIEEKAAFLQNVWEQRIHIFPDFCTETTHCFGDCTDTPNCIKQWLESEVTK